MATWQPPFMTAIVGLIDTDQTVYIAGDSAGTNGNGDQSVFGNPKVFHPTHGPWFLMGCCDTFRLAQVLQYSLRPPLPPGPNVDLQHFMATEFVDSIRACFKKTGFEGGGSFLVGYQGQLFRIEENYQVLVERRNYMAIGSGEQVALGSLYATENIASVAERLSIAMKAAAHFNAFVREPFVVLRLPFFPDWHEEIRKKRRRKRKNVKKKSNEVSSVRELRGDGGQEPDPGGAGS